MAFIAPAIGIAGSLLGGIFGSNSARKAAEQQERFAKILAGQTAQTGQAATDRYGKMWERGEQGYQPYADIGSAATASLKNLLGLGSDPGAAGAGSLTSEIPLNLPGALNLKGSNLQGFKFDPSKAAVDPSLAFRLSQGQQAIERSAAAKGGLLGGGTAKALEEYSQGLGSEEYQAMFNRGLTEYNTDYASQLQNYQSGTNAELQNWQAGVQNALNQFNATNTNRQNIYGRLSGTMGMGQQVAGSLAGLEQTYGQNVAQSEMSTQEQINQLMMGAGNAQAAGTMGSANAWQNALGGITNTMSQYANMQQLSKLLSMQSSGGGGGANLAGFAPSGINPATGNYFGMNLQ